MASELKEIAATATVYASQARLQSVVVSAAADAASVVLRDGGASGTIRLTVKAPIGETTVWTAGASEGVFFGTDIHATVVGTSPAVDVEYEAVG